METKEKKYLLGIKLIPYLNRHLSKVLQVFGSAERVWNASSHELQDFLGIPLDCAQKICADRNIVDVDLELEKLNACGVRVLAVDDPSYPELLGAIAVPPVLFYKGDLIRSFVCAVAIVGSRKASVHGREFAFQLARQLSEMGVTIVSGLARGIDSASHRGALAAKGDTMGVLGCGIDVVYPPENRKLYLEISSKGSLVSEYPLGSRPFPQNFPARNRIISGLCEGVVVVEASERSGALITADFALEQGREVMVVPGNVKSSLSKGCHKLIKQGAYLIETVDDVVEILQLEKKLPELDVLLSGKGQVELECDEQNILECLGWEPKHVDQILQVVPFDIAKVITLLTMLEIKGFVRQDIGNLYVRIQ